jgi:hypothetical protein
MTGMRRCENAVRRGEPAVAARSAEEAIALYPASTLARTCLGVVLRFNDVAADSVVRVADAVLALDSVNILMAVVRARSLSSLDAKTAPEAWGHVIRLRPDSLDLALTGLDEMMRLASPRRALDATQLLPPDHRQDPRVRRIAFRAYIAMASWKSAALLGDSLDAEDKEFRGDSTYGIRHVEALRLSGDTLAALSKSARSVREHPGDVALYLQYVKLVHGENSAALARGLAFFPRSSDLHVLAARASIAAGKRREAIASLSAAVGTDSLLTQGFLQMAELWFDEDQPDSALAVIARSSRGGIHAELLRTYAIARGRQMIRGVSDSASTTWRRALTLFSIADSVESRDDTRSLIAASTLQLARGALVVVSKAHDCPDANRANDALVMTAAVLARGVGEGPSADELRDAYGAMRPIADQALRLYCPGRAP